MADRCDNSPIPLEGRGARSIVSDTRAPQAFPLAHARCGLKRGELVRPSGEGWEPVDEALPCHKATAKRSNRCLEVGAESEGLHLSSIALLMWMVSPARPPSSATRGAKYVPEERQAERLLVNFLCTPTSRSWPGVWAASASTSKTEGPPVTLWRMRAGLFVVNLSN